MQKRIMNENNTATTKVNKILNHSSKSNSGAKVIFLFGYD